MYCNKISFQELLDHFGNNLKNNLENNAHGQGKLQKILNRIM